MKIQCRGCGDPPGYSKLFAFVYTCSSFTLVWKLGFKKLTQAYGYSSHELCIYFVYVAYGLFRESVKKGSPTVDMFVVSVRDLTPIFYFLHKNLVFVFECTKIYFSRGVSWHMMSVDASPCNSAGTFLYTSRQ